MSVKASTTEVVGVEPMLRPELSSIEADITLPEYLGHSGRQHKDVRGGAISMVNGSQVTFVATMNRKLSAAQITTAQAASPVGVESQ